MRDSTKKQCKVYIDKWLLFVNSKNENLFNPEVSLVIEFLNYLCNQGLSYSYINTACSALPVLTVLKDNSTVGKHPTVKIFLQGRFNARPPTPKYTRA